MRSVSKSLPCDPIQLSCLLSARCSQYVPYLPHSSVHYLQQLSLTGRVILVTLQQVSGKVSCRHVRISKLKCVTRPGLLGAPVQGLGIGHPLVYHYCTSYCHGHRTYRTVHPINDRTIPSSLHPYPTGYVSVNRTPKEKQNCPLRIVSIRGH